MMSADAEVMKEKPMPRKTETIAMCVNRRELATILAALRFHQDENLQSGRGIPDQVIKEIATDGSRLRSMTFQEVDRLCQRLNKPEGTPSPTGLVIEPPHKEGGKEPLFRVVYVIDVNAMDPLDAAKRTHRIMADPESLAPVLEVMDHRGHVTRVDLSEECPIKKKGEPCPGDQEDRDPNPSR
jgi:hypothetical protein